MGRPSKTLISHEGAVEAALAVIDEQGLNSFSIELVARKLGVKAPSLYYHFSNKAEILSEVALKILTDIDAPQVDQNDWENTVVDLCVATRRSILKHANAAPLLLEYFPRHIFSGAYDFWAGQCPYPVGVHLQVIEGMENLTYGNALFAAASVAHDIPPMPELDETEFPQISKAVKANKLNEEEMFAESIRRFLRGFSAA